MEIRPKARFTCWVLFLALCLLFAYVGTHASELVVGERYVDAPLVCLDVKDAQLVAETYVKKGEEALDTIMVKMVAEHKCISGIKISFVIKKLVSKHTGKETLYVSEIQTDDLIHHLVSSNAVIPRKRNLNAEA